MSRFIVTQGGKKLPIDDSTIDEDYYFTFRRNVHVIDDDDKLKKCWILQLQEKSNVGSHRTLELELKQELRYDHYPTETEIMWAMSEYGICSGVATVAEGWEFDY